jgi:Kelch motif
LNSAERYDPSTGKWEELPPMLESRRSLALVAMPDGVYAIGGYNGSNYLATVEKFDC